MSRRHDEFKHRTSIFEGAYRAWSHLGGLDPDVLGKKSASELDPLTYRLVNDTRPRPSKASKTQPVNMSAQLDLPYERLPPSGLLHPFVSAILLPWLGPHADSEAVKFGLATLRTWWQHRSNSLNKTAIKKLQDSEFRAIVDQYTHHFFELAHCLVVHDKEQGPSTLQKKLKRAQTELDKGLLSDRFNSDRSLSVVQMLVGDSAGLSPLEKMHAAQKLIAEGVSSMNRNKNAGQIVNVKGKCIPGKIDLSNMAHTVNRYNSTQLAHRGISSLSPPKENSERFTNPHSEAFRFGDPKSTPVIYKDLRGDSLIVLEIAGISCAHCVQIVETVLKGCKGHGQQSPITGLLDAAADHKLSLVVIRIEDTTDGSRALAEAGSLQNIAKKVAYEACRNLALVGYTAQAKKASMGSNEEDDNDQLKDDLCLPLKCLQTTIATYANAYPRNFFDFSLPCTCPDNGIFRASCPRHLQMSDVLMELFADHEKRLGEHIDSKISLSLDDNGLELFTDTEHSESTNFDQGRGVTVLEWITNTDASSNDTPMLLVEKSIATEMESTEPIPFYSSDHICLPDSFGAIQDRHNVVPEWAMNWAASVVEEKKRDIRSEIGHASVEETTKKVVTLRDDYHYQSSH